MSKTKEERKEDRLKMNDQAIDGLTFLWDTGFGQVALDLRRALRIEALDPGQGVVLCLPEDFPHGSMEPPVMLYGMPVTSWRSEFREEDNGHYDS